MADNVENINITTDPLSSKDYTTRTVAPKYLVFHYTAGYSSKKGEALHAKEWAGKTGQVGAEFSVDDELIVQHIDPEKYHSFAIGSHVPGSDFRHNNCINVEMCSQWDYNKYPKDPITCDYPNVDGYTFTEAVLNNAYKLGRYIIQKYNISPENIVSHHIVNDDHKKCPGIKGWNKGEWYNYNTTTRKGELCVDANGNTVYNTDEKFTAFRMKLGASGPYINATYNGDSNGTMQATQGQSSVYIIHDQNLPQYKESGEEGQFLKNAMNNKSSSGTLNMDIDTSYIKHTRIYKATEPKIILAEMYLPLEKRSLNGIEQIDSSINDMVSSKNSSVNSSYGTEDVLQAIDTNGRVIGNTSTLNTEVTDDKMQYLINRNPNYKQEYDEWVRQPDTEGTGDKGRIFLDNIYQKENCHIRIVEYLDSIIKNELDAEGKPLYNSYEILYENIELLTGKPPKDFYVARAEYVLLKDGEELYLIDKIPNYDEQYKKWQSEDYTTRLYINNLESEESCKTEANKQLADLILQLNEEAKDHLFNGYKINDIIPQKAYKKDDKIYYMAQVTFELIKDPHAPYLAAKLPDYEQKFKEWEEASKYTRIYIPPYEYKEGEDPTPMFDNLIYEKGKTIYGKKIDKYKFNIVQKNIHNAYFKDDKIYNVARVEYQIINLK